MLCATRIGIRSVKTTPIIPYRYWRLNITSSVVSSTSSLLELELRATIGGADLTSPATVVIASSSSGGDTPNRIIDNQFGSAWSATFNPSWIQFDLVSPTTVAEIAMWPRTDLDASPKDFDIQGSNDGVTFTTVKTFTNITGWVVSQWRTFTL